MALISETDTVAPAPEAPDVSGLELSKAALRRLRWYYEIRRGGKVRAQFDGADLDLLHVGAINYILGHNNVLSDYAVITRLGIQVLARDRERNRITRQPHHLLAHKLGDYLRGRDRLVWENIEFKVGPSAYARPDVFSVMATHVEKRLAPMVHEVKISRADFLADVANQKKRDGYAKIAQCVYYAMSDGLAEPNEVPDGCGLLVLCDNGSWVVRKRAKRNAVTLTAWHYMNLVLKRPNQGHD